MLKLKPISETKTPVYAVVVTKNEITREPIIAFSKDECIKAFVYEIIKYAISDRKMIYVFYEMFPELKMLFRDKGDPSPMDVYLFVTGHNMDEVNLVNEMLTKLNICYPDCHPYITNKSGNIDYGEPITADTDLEFEIYTKNGRPDYYVEYKIVCYTPEQMNAAVDMAD